MEPIIEDFVNRGSELNYLWRMAQREVEPRILAVEGLWGIGKTELLSEFIAECREKQIELVHIDFDERDADPGYMYVIFETMIQLGPDGFDHMFDTLRIIRTQSLGDLVRKAAGDFDEAAKEPPESLNNAETRAEQDEERKNSDEHRELAEPGRTGGVNIYGGRNTFRDVAGRDINYFIQVVEKEDPYVQIKVPGWIAKALNICLAQISAERQVLFFFDHWEKADGDTRKWVVRSIFKWAADDALGNSVIVVAGEKGYDLVPRRLQRTVQLGILDDRFVREYLLKKDYDPEKVAAAINTIKGNPMMMKLAVSPNGSPSSDW